MWWKTTEVYRVSLPYNGIKDLTNTPIQLRSNVGIYSADVERSNLFIAELTSLFKNNIVKVNFYPVSIDKAQFKNIHTPTGLQKLIEAKYEVRAGDFIFFEWPKLTEDILVTADRYALISANTTSIKIKQVLEHWILLEQKLSSILEYTQTTKNHSKSKEYNSAAPQPHYDVLISVLNPRPDLQTVQWNVRSAIETYIQPFLDEISLLSNFTLKSQWKYQVPFDFPTKQVQDNSKLGRHYALHEEHLPHIITSIERKLGNSISDNPCIHLVVYVPPCEKSPLHIYNMQNKKSSEHNVDSFISEKWGGIVIANPSEAVCLDYMDKQEKVDVLIRSDHVMQILLYTLRKLIDLQNDIPIDRAQIDPLDSLKPRVFEVDAYLRCGVVHLISSATSTLQSLIQLLDGISNIVINDEVGVAVNEAYTNIILAKESLKLNEIVNATAYAKKAFIASETAFFHPSMLALLYFPDDQKYAIYIPLFLPIMIPVILSTKTIYCFFFAKEKLKVE